MKVIFVASGNKSVGQVSAFVQSQFDSLKEKGLEMRLFPVVGHGTKAHILAAWQLRKLIRREKPNIVHAHYSVCGYVSTLATLFLRPRVVVSILGSFPKENRKARIVRFFIKHVWDRTLVKSRRTANQLGMDLPVIPNGVNLSQFHVIDQAEARIACGFDEDKRYVVWCSNPARSEKRYPLAKQSVATLKDDHVVLVPVFNHPHDEVVRYMCAADVLLLTSISEGSPNVIKEAMACNCPVVSTDVGDVRWVTDGVDGTYVAEHDDPVTIGACLRKALAFGKRTSGRDAVVIKGLTSESIADKIIALYSSL